MSRILVIETDRQALRGIAQSLQQQGLSADDTASARDALYRVTSGAYALVIVAYDLPEIDGPALVAAMRATGLSVPMLAIDAQGSIERCVRMLKAGADDYQPFPLDLEELGARVLALLRRQARPPAPADDAAAARACRRAASCWTGFAASPWWMPPWWNCARPSSACSNS